MSALTQAVDNLERGISGLPCSVAKARATLDDESAADFDAWLAGKVSLSDDQMWRGLQSLGHRVGRQTVGRHRRGDCRCFQ